MAMEKDEAVRKLGSGSFVVALGMMLGLLISYLFKVVAARFLGPDLYGVYAQAFGVVQAVSVIAVLGIQVSLPRFMSFHRGREEKDEVRESITTAVFLVLPSALLFSLFTFQLSGSIAVVLGDPRLASAIKMLSLGIVPFSLLPLLISVFRGFQDARSKLLIDDILEPAVSAAGLTLLILAGMGLEAAILGRVIGTLIAVLAGILLLRRRLSFDLFDFSRFSPGRIIAFSWPLFLISILEVVDKWYGVLLLGFFRDSSSAGAFEVVLSLAYLLVWFLGSVSYMFMPVVSELYGEGRLDEVMEVYSTAVRWTMTVIAPVFIGLLVFPAEIIELLFGPEYVGGATALSLLSIGFFVHVVAGPSENALISAGKTRKYLVSYLVMSLSGIGAAIFLIPGYGLEGAAAAIALGVTSGNLLMLWYLREELGSLPYNRKILTLSGIVVLSTVVLSLAKNVVEPGLQESIVLGAISVVFYGFLVYTFVGILPPEREAAAKVRRDIMEFTGL